MAQHCEGEGFGVLLRCVIEGRMLLVIEQTSALKPKGPTFWLESGIQGRRVRSLGSRVRFKVEGLALRARRCDLRLKGLTFWLEGATSGRGVRVLGF